MLAWKPLRTLAETNLNGWRIDFEPTRPSLPITFRTPQGKGWPALAVEPLPSHSMQVEELYVRQSDLIVRFAQGRSDRFGFQIDWRLIEPPKGFDLGLEVWISVQTNLLDAAPQLRVASSGNSQAQWREYRHQQLSIDRTTETDGWADGLKSSIAALGIDQEGCHGLWLIEPRDQSQLRWKSKPSAAVRQAELFGQFLEKGVIRRARMQLLVRDQPISETDIQQAYQALLQRDLPLTV